MSSRSYLTLSVYKRYYANLWPHLVCQFQVVVVVAAVIVVVYLTNLTTNYTDTFNLKTSKLIQLRKFTGLSALNRNNLRT